QPGVRYSVSHPHKVLRVNIEGTLNVLVAARKSEVDKVIYASSSSVYGAPRYLPIDEGHPAVPVSPYGASKLAAEGYCRVFQELYGIKVVILRYFTAYGPRQRPDMAIHRFARAILEGKPITVYGDGAQTRDFTYVEDIVRGTILAAEKGEAVGQCFNLGGGRRTSINALVRLLEEVSGREAKVAYVEPMLGDVPHTHADVSKARRVLGYEPRVGLRDGLSAFVDWLDKGLGRRVNPVEKEDPIGTRGRIAP
ncbi:TPA: NAD-dependent epimerase/dehydratase family protein, partial [Candidatus Bathyarchaeota archaeon]|nr:NAD-dependent epimerase/dehydratase family protein [Candidatus Bathyarchaeota archaeon]